MMPLLLVQTGEDVRLVKIRGGRGLRKRMADLGMNPGTPLRIVSKNRSGPLIIALKESRMAIGRGMAAHIMVAPLDSEII